MEHLPLPHGAVITTEERASYIAEPYDGGPFVDYPSRSRFAELYSIFVKDGQIRICPIPSEKAHLLADLEIILETWLFFGLIQEMFGDLATPDMFIDRYSDSSQPLLTTAKLAQIVNDWVTSKDKRVEADMNSFAHLNVCFQMKDDVLAGVTLRPISSDLKILRVIACLGETLEHVVRGACDGLPLKTGWSSLRESLGYLQLLKDNGWCPMLVQKSDKRNWTGLSSHHYLSKLRQSNGRAHVDCTESACRISTYGINGKTVAHRCATESCNSVVVDEHRVQSILGAGSIALLDILDFEADNDSGLRVVSSTVAPRYIALSHVWADGLGNPIANALPECQITYLASLVRDMEQRQSSQSGQRLHLWLDTLCCPVNSDHHRNLCLASMRRIYREATYVLVLDPTLSRKCRSDIDDLEVCARILFSRWTSRLWTLQEGVLAKDLYFQLSDHAVSAASVANSIKAMHNVDYTRRALISPFGSRLTEIQSLINTESKVIKVTDIMDVISALGGRDVTVPSDEPLCLCTCLGLDQGDIISARGDSRMSVFYRTLTAAGQAISRDFIFFSGDRLDDHGLRWAAKSLLDRTQFWRPARLRAAEDRAILTHDGLRFQYPGLRVQLGYPLSSDDITKLDEYYARHPGSNFNELPLAMRHPRLGWFDVTRTPWTASIRPLDILRDQGGSGVFIMTSELEDCASQETSPHSCASVVGQITHVDGRVNFHVVRSAHAFSKPYAEHETLYEAAWRVLHHGELKNRPLLPLRSPSEVPLPADHVLKGVFEILPDAAATQLYDLACKESTSLTRLGHSVSGALILVATVMLLAQQCCEIVEVWPKSQEWCLE